MNREDTKKYLRLLGQELQQRQVTGQILLAEGIVMVLDVRKPEGRKDIKAYLQGDKSAIDIPKSIDAYFLPDFTAVAKAAAVVAGREGLDDSWLNSAAAGFTYFFTRQPDRKLWKEFPGLRVYTASLEYIFTTKIMAGRFKDEVDIIALIEKLGVTNREDVIALLARYVPEESISEDLLDEIEERFGL